MNPPSASSAVQTEEIKTAHTTTLMERQPGCRLKLEIRVSPEATNAAHSKAIKNVSNEISLPGFRKGKAPKSLILKQFGKQVKSEWNDVVANTAFQEFMEHSKLYPFTKDKSIKRLDVKNISQEQGAEIIIEYETGPLIPKVDKAKLKIEPITRRTITSKDIEDRLYNLQLHHGDWSIVTDRPIQEGDFVDLDIVAIDSHPPRPICEEMRFEVAEGKMGDWMRKLLVGMTTGTSVEGMSERDDKNFSETDFKPTQCCITVRALYSATLPPLDDDFASKFKVANIEELRQRVEEDLNRRADAEVEDQNRAQVEEQLLNLYPFDLPSSMILEQKRQMVAEKLAHIQKVGSVTTPLPELRQEVDRAVTSELTRAYRLFFMCREIAEEEKIEVFQHEISDEMSRQMMLFPDQALNLSKMGEEEMQSKLYVNVLTRKALDFLAS